MLYNLGQVYNSALVLALVHASPFGSDRSNPEALIQESQVPLENPFKIERQIVSDDAKVECESEHRFTFGRHLAEETGPPANPSTGVFNLPGGLVSSGRWRPNVKRCFKAHYTGLEHIMAGLK